MEEEKIDIEIAQYKDLPGHEIEKIQVDETAMNKAAEKAVSEALGLTKLTNVGLGGGGCISSGSAYDTDKYGRVFIKVNSKSGAQTMFEGEYASLEALYNTHTVKCPKPIKVVKLPDGGSVLVMGYMDMKQGLGTYSELLGEQLARLHLHNETLKTESSDKYVGQFGFHVNTCCGYIPQDNTWSDDWPTFYAKKIEMHLDMLEKKGVGKEARDLWTQLMPNYQKFFEGIEITPALVHGDLWSGNACENISGPIVFDPASFYGHSEFDLAITFLFGGFSPQFYNGYHRVIHRAPGLRKRKDLYKLFHYINHWNHFGEGYKDQTLSTLQKCLNFVKEKG